MNTKQVMTFVQSDTGTVLVIAALVFGGAWYVKRQATKTIESVGEAAKKGANAINPLNNDNIINKSLTGGVTLVRDVLDDGYANDSKPRDWSLGVSIYEFIHGENG